MARALDMKILAFVIIRICSCHPSAVWQTVVVTRMATSAVIALLTAILCKLHSILHGLNRQF